MSSSTTPRSLSTLDTENYVVTDSFFGTPYVDVDEWRDDPVPHRYIHGGFRDTDTRFAFQFPPVELYRGRMYMPLAGGHAGDETVNSTFHGALITGGIEMIFRLGGYAVESNMGHIGEIMDPRAGDDPTIYGWRGAAECARYSKFLASQVLGSAPGYSYVYGGSGGARRSPLCLAYAPDVFDGAVPYMGDAEDGDHGDFSRLRTGTGHFASMFNVQRVLRDRIYDVMDAMAPGGSGDPFATLDMHQRDELALLYRLGFPRGDEFMIAQPMGQMWLWTSMASTMTACDPYFTNFWTRPGHVGHDLPQLVEADLIDTTVPITRVLSGQDVMDDPTLAAPEFEAFRALVQGVMMGTGMGYSLPCVIEVAGLGSGYRLGSGVRITSGEAAGRQLYCLGHAGNFLFCNGAGEVTNVRFSGVRAGDSVHISNRDFLAYCYYPRHHLNESAGYDTLRIGGLPIHTQYEQPLMSPFMGTCHTGRFPGKMIWVQHTHDSSLWPIDGIGMRDNVLREVGPDESARHFRLRWTENAEHVPPLLAAGPPGRATTTWLVDYLPVIEQTLLDLTAWVEEGVEPAQNTFDLIDGQISMPHDADARGGIQPVVTVTANGSRCANVGVGDHVELEARAEVATGAGTIISVRWDFDGTGTYPETVKLDGAHRIVSASITHAYDRPGTYFVTALAESHRDGDMDALHRRVANVGSARVVVE
jgi:hypothetical protein